MSLSAQFYDAAIRVIRGSAPLWSRGSFKRSRGVEGRKGALERLRSWAEAHRDPARPLVWFHAPSVGEGHQARSVLEALREERPELQSIFTIFSPSAEAFARGLPVDAADYLPWDVRAELDGLFDAVAPSLIAFTKTEVWPGLTAVAAAHGVPVVLTAATLPEGSGRLRPLARPLLQPAFSTLERVLAIAEEDGARFRRLDVAEDRIQVTGDPGIDSAQKRAGEADPAAPYLAPFHADPRPTLVAGSTWPADERILVPAAARVREERPDVRLVVAPHEPHEGHLRPLAAALGAAGFQCRTLAEMEAAECVEGVDAVLVDRVGVLSHLYTVGTWAYVGGGFGKDGLHSVLEPAAAGLPTLFGPRYAGSRAAVDLVSLGGGRAVDDAEDLAAVLHTWLSDPELQAEVAGQAHGYIESHRGAAGRTAKAMAALLSPS